jgi:hypothetical protein
VAIIKQQNNVMYSSATFSVIENGAGLDNPYTDCSQQVQIELLKVKIQ